MEKLPRGSDIWKPMKKVWAFFKKEVVLCVAWILAFVSAFFVKPDQEYIKYIDFRTLALLFGLMAIMEGFSKLEVFQWIAEGLLTRVKKVGQLILILMMLCFFFGMLITNDVALIVFVPFTFIILKILGEEYRQKLLVPVVVMQTIAANMGSMLTPIGNPQNMYLCNLGDFGLVEFIKNMLPYTALAFVLLVAWALISGKSASKENSQVVVEFKDPTSLKGKGMFILVYLVLFILCILVVAKVLPYEWVFLAVVVVIGLMDRKVFLKVDYTLLLTFTGFFIFTGNMGRIPQIADALKNLLEQHEVFTTIVSCQFMSNVPAAILLSGFTDRLDVLTITVNVGGLGSLIASMASLISYKYVVKEAPEKKGKYFLTFTVAGICFLIPQLILFFVLH